MKLQNVRSLPEVMTRQQVYQIVDACTTERMAVYFWTVYSLGLRMQEELNLQVGDVDADRGLVHVHRGKGAKDRYVPLPASTLDLLRKFPGHASTQTVPLPRGRWTDQGPPPRVRR